MAIDIAAVIAGELNVRPAQAARAIELFDNDNTVPFVARYRKEMTGGLDEVQLWSIQERLGYLRHLEERKTTILAGIEEQGKLTPELRDRIQASATLQEVEDLYLPFRPKRRTRATVARERGLVPLADLLLELSSPVIDWVPVTRPFISQDVPTVEAALAGARDIIAEQVAEDADLRSAVREMTRASAVLTSTVIDESKDERAVYRTYYAFQEKVSSLLPHRLLAVNRGEREGVLKARLERPDGEMVSYLRRKFVTHPESGAAGEIALAIADGYERLMAPSIERELRHELSQAADEHAIRNFASNLRQLLLQPPIAGKTVIGIDPGFRTGCKVAVVDPTGKFLSGLAVYPHEPQRQWQAAKETIAHLILELAVDVIAIGNGTASRETEALAGEVIADLQGRREVAYVLVNEAGASVYSASEIARTEFPDLDVSMRGAVSIARRLQDPLAELVKIEPKSIGVGLYQHDVDQKRLGQALDTVVTSAVNHVGVDVNTASSALLGYVAGINRRVADSIVKFRQDKGRFRAREELRRVKGLGDKAFEQSVGFLKIPGGVQPLDNTFIHPESYPKVEALFRELGLSGQERDLPARMDELRRQKSLARLARTLDMGEPTLRDVLEALARPGRDPRDELPRPLLRRDVLKMEDLSEGMVLQGTVRNVVDFGAFIDVGVKQDGLVHVSQIADRFVRDPFQVVAVGDIVRVKVLQVDAKRGRISLSMKGLPPG